MESFWRVRQAGKGRRLELFNEDAQWRDASDAGMQTEMNRRVHCSES
jgi:hypothetical protein